MSFILDTCFICTVIILIFPFFICIEDILNGFKLPDGINSKQFNMRHFMPNISVLFIHTSRLSFSEFRTKSKTNKDVHPVFTHPKHLQPLITTHLNVNWLNYCHTLSPHPIVSRHYRKWKVRCDPDLFAQVPGAAQCPSLSPGWFTADKVSRIGSHTLWGPWTCAGLADPKLEVQGVPQVPPSCREPAGTETSQTQNLLQREPSNCRCWKPGKPEMEER